MHWLDPVPFVRGQFCFLAGLIAASISNRFIPCGAGPMAWRPDGKSYFVGRPRRLAGRWIVAALSAGLGLPLSSAEADVTWESFFSDEATITTGAWIDATDVRVSFTAMIFSDSDGGTFDLNSGRNASYCSFESGVTGNHSGYLEMSFDNQNNDPADFIELQLTFDRPLQNLRFSLLDVDGSPGRSWDDAVEVFFNGINVRDDPTLFSYGSAVFLDDESYMQGFEAETTSSSATQTLGNIDFDFGLLWVNQLRIVYRTTDDALSNPSAQFIGLGDMAYDPIPEPGGIGWFLSAGIAGWVWGQNSRSLRRRKSTLRAS